MILSYYHRISNIFLIIILSQFIEKLHAQSSSGGGGGGGLSNYCSSVNGNELLQKFQNCTFFKNIKSSDLQHDYDEMKKILNKVFASINQLDSASSSINNKLNSKNLFLELLKVDKLAKKHGVQFCLSSLCNLFKNCEFPIDIEYKTFENDALVAARMASRLTEWSINEKLENKIFLTKINLFSLLRSIVVDNENIYDSKIAFLRTPDQERIIFQASKDLDNKIIEVQDFTQIIENTKNFQWYFKWITEKTQLNLSKSWIFKMDSLKNYMDSNQFKSLNQMPYPNSFELDSIRYVSDITYDCLKGIWNRIVSLPFFNSNGEIRGVISIAISLNKFDLKQCGGDNDEDFFNNSQNATNYFNKYRDPFYGTDKCDRATTHCVNIEGRGFVLDSYECKCKSGFYQAVNATRLGDDKNSTILSCLKCPDGCETCDSDKPCKTNVSINFKRIALIINLSCIFICFILALLLWYHMKLKVLKTSSPKMLFIVLFGAVVSYSEMIPMYFEPSYLTCTIAQVLQLEGFLLAYGALVLKTWRECKLFYVRSVKTIKIPDKSLVKWLGIILLIGTTFLVAWAFRKDESPRQETRYDPDGLKYETCTITEWNFVSMTIQLAILLWGAVLSVQVRRASIAFKETKLITWAIFNEGVVCCFVISINALLYPNATKVSCYVPFLLNFIRIHLTITVMLLLLFSYKVYKIILARNKPYQGNQTSLLNSFGVSNKDGEPKNATVNDETEKEKELKIEIQRLYRQIEEMRSLSMRIANPYFIPKKSRFGNPTKKSKIKTKNFHEVELSKLNNSTANNAIDSDSAGTQIEGSQSVKLIKKSEATKLLPVDENK